MSQNQNEKTQGNRSECGIIPPSSGSKGTGDKFHLGVVGKNIEEVSEEKIIAFFKCQKFSLENTDHIMCNIFSNHTYNMSKIAPMKNTIVELRNSPIHGRGVFAATDIKKNTVLTFYPAHCTILGGARHCRVSLTFANDESELYFTPIKGDDFDCEKHDPYKLNITKNIRIYGNPTRINDPSLLGHMINDSSSYSINKSMTDLNIKNSIVRYILSSNNNARLKISSDACVAYAISTRDIKQNEEITASYGLYYWCNPSENTRIENIIKNDAKLQYFILKHSDTVFVR